MPKSKAAWEKLLVCTDLERELDTIYTEDVLERLSHLMEKSDDPDQLRAGVHKTARSFLCGKYEKQVEQGEILQHTGRHLANVGIASKQLAYSLKQVTKSTRAQELLAVKLANTLAEGRPFGKDAYHGALYRNGPALPLAYLQEIAAALSEAVDELVDMPDRTDDKRAVRDAGEKFVTEFSAIPHPVYTDLPTNHPIENAALTFKETWETYSDAPYIRGGFKHDRGGYDSLPAYGLYLIVSPLDPTLKESLCGTAIENIRKRKKN